MFTEEELEQTQFMVICDDEEQQVTDILFRKSGKIVSEKVKSYYWQMRVRTTPRHRGLTIVLTVTKEDHFDEIRDTAEFEEFEVAIQRDREPTVDLRSVSIIQQFFCIRESIILIIFTAQSWFRRSNPNTWFCESNSVQRKNPRNAHTRDAKPQVCTRFSFGHTAGFSASNTNRTHTEDIFQSYSELRPAKAPGRPPYAYYPQGNSHFLEQRQSLVSFERQ